MAEQTVPVPSGWDGIDATTGIDGSLTLEYTEPPTDTTTDPRRINVGDIVLVPVFVHATADGFVQVSHDRDGSNGFVVGADEVHHTNTVQRLRDQLADARAAVRGEPHTTPTESEPACCHKPGGVHTVGCPQRCWDCRRAPDGRDACRCGAPEGGGSRG